jgi:hypothetical protein
MLYKNIQMNPTYGWRCVCQDNITYKGSKVEGYVCSCSAVEGLFHIQGKDIDLSIPNIKPSVLPTYITSIMLEYSISENLDLGLEYLDFVVILS